MDDSPCVQNVQICTEQCTKAFSGRSPPGSARELTALPDPLAGLRRRERRGREMKRRGKEDAYPLLGDYLATPMAWCLSDNPHATAANIDN